MAEVNFCPSCGKKKVEKADFCVSCGQKLSADQDSGSYLLKALIGALIVSTMAVVIIRYGVLAQEGQPAKVAPQETKVAEHSHEDTPQLAALREEAKNGEVGALLDLAEAEISMSAKDRHYLAAAAKTLERVAVSYPDHGYSLRMLANIYYDMGKSEQSVTWYRRFLKLYPNDANARVDMGTQLLKLGRIQDAIDQDQLALEIFPNFYNAYYNMYVAYEQMGRKDEAAVSKEKALEIEKTHGKLLATELDLPRLPEGAAAAAIVSTPKNYVTEGIDYAPVEAFFRVHPIIGPKITAFKAEAGKGVLIMHDFPMDKMPPGVRGILETKINNMMGAMGPQAGLIIKDEQDDRTMATYGKK